jgi:hypothetical protein
MSVSASGVDLSDDGIRIESVAANWASSATGSVSVETTLPSAGPRLDVRLGLDADASAGMEATYVEEGVTKQAGLDAKMNMSFSSRLGLQFDQLRRLTAFGSGGKVFADGSVHVWNETHPKSQMHEPEDVEHPFIDESHAYSEESVGASGPADALAVDFLTRLWNAGVAVGDEYRFLFNMDEGANQVSYSFTVQVVAKESRTAAGRSFDSLRVSQTSKLVTRTAGSGVTDFEVLQFTLWVDAKSSLLVYAQGEYAKSYSKEDLRRLIEAVGEEFPTSVPNTFALAVTGSTVLRLDAYSGDFETAPMFGILGLPTALLGSGAMGWPSSDEEAYAVPA